MGSLGDEFDVGGAVAVFGSWWWVGDDDFGHAGEDVGGPESDGASVSAPGGFAGGADFAESFADGFVGLSGVFGLGEDDGVSGGVDGGPWHGVGSFRMTVWPE